MAHPFADGEKDGASLSSDSSQKLDFLPEISKYGRVRQYESATIDV